MTCPHCGKKTRSKTVCPTCGRRSRRTIWLLVAPLAIALIAFATFIGNAYFTDMLRSTDSLADQVDLPIGEDTVSADEATTADFDTLQESLFSVSYGTGFLVSSRDVVTAASNVAGLTNIIMYHDGQAVSGTVVGRTSFIAVIRIEETDKTPFLLTQAIAAEDENLITLTMKERMNGTVTFAENGYIRNFELPRHAYGSPLLSASGRVVAIHLRGIALPTALFERDLRTLIDSDVAAPPPVELAPVEPIRPDLTEEPVVIPEAPSVPETQPELPPATEPEAPAEENVEEEVVEEETEPDTPEVTPEEPTEPPTEPTEPVDPPETEEPIEDDPPVTEPEVPTEPEKPVEPEEPAEPEEPTTLEPDGEDDSIVEDDPVTEEDVVEEENVEENDTSTPSE
ncbi:hypothetical protein [Exiguobacterium sp. CH10]|uniref:hypothetical protein n=1 Tax=Exiguobacterium sp. CH10 TaxID=2751261 RepID=UPI001BE8156E|nr:hypothetical protein [Exiguobacterium sp. CH10]